MNRKKCLETPNGFPWVETHSPSNFFQLAVHFHIPYPIPNGPQSIRRSPQALFSNSTLVIPPPYFPPFYSSICAAIDWQQTLIIERLKFITTHSWCTSSIDHLSMLNKNREPSVNGNVHYSDAITGWMDTTRRRMNFLRNAQRTDDFCSVALCLVLRVG